MLMTVWHCVKCVTINEIYGEFDMKVKLYFLMMVAVMTTILGACTATPQIVQKRFFWPPEPDQPRVEWIATYLGDIDITEKGLMSVIVGDDPSVEFKRPVSVAGDGEGRFVVSDPELGQVFLFDLKRREAFLFGGSAGAADFKQPSGVAVDGEGNFYVADTASRKVFIANGANSILRVLDLSEHVKSIGSLVVDRARARLVIPDAKGSKVLIFTLTGELLLTVEGKGYFSYPNAVAVLSDGSMVIADSFNATIVRFSAEGKYLNSIGRRGDIAGSLSLVTGVAVDSEDHIYATDGRLHTVTLFEKDGNALLVIGGPFSISRGNIARGGFQIPQGISIDKNDRIYVADSFNRRVQVFQYLSKRYLEDHPIDQTRQLP